MFIRLLASIKNSYTLIIIIIIIVDKTVLIDRHSCHRPMFLNILSLVYVTFNIVSHINYSQDIINDNLQDTSSTPLSINFNITLSSSTSSLKQHEQRLTNQPAASNLASSLSSSSTLSLSLNMLGQCSEIEDEDSLMEIIELSIRTYLPRADRRQSYRNSSLDSQL